MLGLNKGFLLEKGNHCTTDRKYSHLPLLFCCWEFADASNALYRFVCDDQKEYWDILTRSCWRSNYWLNRCCVFIPGHSCHVNQQNPQHLSIPLFRLALTEVPTNNWLSGCFQSSPMNWFIMILSLSLFETEQELTRVTITGTRGPFVSIYKPNTMLALKRMVEIVDHAGKRGRWPQFLAGQLANQTLWPWAASTELHQLGSLGWGSQRDCQGVPTQFKQSNLYNRMILFK